MKCLKCGTELTYGMDHCDFCYNDLTDRQIMMLTQEEHNKDYNLKYGSKINAKKRFKKIVMIIAVTVCSFALLGGVVKIAFDRSIFTLIEDGGYTAFRFVSGIITRRADDINTILDETEKAANEAYTEVQKYGYKDLNKQAEEITRITKSSVSYMYPKEEFTLRIEVNSKRVTKIVYNDWVIEAYGGFMRRYRQK